MRDRQLESKLYRARIISSIAATFISLACGSNYVYSAWAPQFADKLKYSTTESNLVGLAGNLGMYSMGVPVGIFVDSKGPRPAVLIGSIMLGLGYFPLHQAYDKGSGSVPLMCVFSFLTGLGGCTAFAAAVKTSALNWPHHRGTATAFPLAAFGLSAFFFSLIGGFLFPGDTNDFLMLLAAGTFGMTLFGFFFLRVIPHSAYHAVAADEDQFGRASHESKGRRASQAEIEPGRSSTTNYTEAQEAHSSSSQAQDEAEYLDVEAEAAARKNTLDYMTSGRSDPGSSYPTTASSTIVPEPDSDDETSSLVSKNSSLPGDVYVQQNIDMDRSHRVDIRGWALMRNLEFWQLFSIMGILAGVGLMTINNIGHSVVALWSHYDDSVSKDVLIQRQQLHVSILSVCSFSGRLLSGVGSDFLVKVVHASRVWCLVIAGFIFFAAQICALNIVNPNLLGFVSGLSGLGYGFLFGVYPSICAESFGIHGLSQNWGFMTLSPVLSGNIFNLFYGIVFDKHSIVTPDGERSCLDGVECYRSAYTATLGACILGFIVTLLVIRHQYLARLREAKTKVIAED